MFGEARHGWKHLWGAQSVDDRYSGALISLATAEIWLLYNADGWDGHLGSVCVPVCFIPTELAMAIGDSGLGR